jgi:hypothetical protein
MTSSQFAKLFATSTDVQALQQVFEAVAMDVVFHLGAVLLDRARAIYNAPCESMTVAELKHEVESLNANVTAEYGTHRVQSASAGLKPHSGGVWPPHPVDGQTITASGWRAGLLEVLAQFGEAAHDEQRLAGRS